VPRQLLLPPDAGWTLDQVVAAGCFVQERLREWGVRVPCENRLERASRLVAEASIVPWADIPKRVQLQVAEAARTVIEQYLIVYAIDAPGDRLRERLRWLLTGGEYAAADARTTPYDVQFELFVGAALVYAGIRGVHLEEPDWRIPAGESEIALAAKRISSRKSLTKRVRKAIAQIRRYELPGLILLNVDSLADRSRPDVAATTVTEVLKEARSLVATLRAEEVVFGLFAFAVSFEWFSVPLGGVLGTRLFTHGEIIATDLREVPMIKAKLGLLRPNIISSIGHAMKAVPE